MSRPSEALQAIIGSILGAVVLIIAEFYPDLGERLTRISGAIIILVSWIAAGVTWYIAHRQRRGELVSNPDGTVEG